MSAVEPTTVPPVRTSARIPSGIKGAIIAARATGLSQAQIAEQFKVHVNTVQRVCAQVAEVDHPSNPLAKDWKSQARVTAQQAVTDGMTQRKDVVSAANIGLKVLYGIGDLSTSSKVEVDADVRLTVAWQPVQGAEYASGVQSVDSTIDAQHKMLSDGESITSDADPT